MTEDVKLFAVRAALTAAVNAKRAQWDALRSMETILGMELDGTDQALDVLAASDQQTLTDFDVEQFISDTRQT